MKCMARDIAVWAGAVFVLCCLGWYVGLGKRVYFSAFARRAFFFCSEGGGRECFVFAVWAVGEGESFFLLSGRCVCVCGNSVSKGIN